MFIKLLFSDPRLFLSLALVVIFSICVHEFMHAYIALKNGDPTAADAGHLTVNPFKQMGWRS
jgi:Zn-dependent protease